MKTQLVSFTAAFARTELLVLSCFLLRMTGVEVVPPTARPDVKI